MNDKKIITKIFWIGFSLYYIASFIWNAWEGRNYKMIELNIILACITSTGLIFYAIKRPLLSQVFWKVYLAIEVLFITFALVTLIITMSMMSSIQLDEPIRFQPVDILIGLIFHFIALYGLWRYAYKSPALWNSSL